MSFPIQQGLFKYDLEDHYAILGVPLDADAKQIRDRYLKIAFRLHPDTCKFKDDNGRRRANKVLSKLVNPAYETLSRERVQAEYLLVLSQTGKNLSQDMARITLASDVARELSQAKNNPDLVYHRLLNPLVAQQYQDLEKLFVITAQISELNLIYLMLKQGKPIQPKSPLPAKRSSESSASASKTTSYNSTNSKPKVDTPPDPEEAEKVSDDKSKASPLDNAIRRATDQMNRGSYSQVIAELREALKIDPNNSTSHSLLGMAYLRQNQLTMAKVHINRAIASNALDPMVIKAKQELNKASGKESNIKVEEKKPGIFSKFFGKDKK